MWEWKSVDGLGAERRVLFPAGWREKEQELPIRKTESQKKTQASGNVPKWQKQGLRAEKKKGREGAKRQPNRPRKPRENEKPNKKWRRQTHHAWISLLPE